MRTGDEAMDTQHRYLIELINELADAVDEGYAEARLGQLLPMLEMSFEWHFEREEDSMLRRNCPLEKENEQANEELLETVKRFRGRHRSEGGNPDLAKEIHKHISDWLVKHLVKTDSAIRDDPVPARAARSAGVRPEADAQTPNGRPKARRSAGFADEDSSDTVQA